MGDRQTITSWAGLLSLMLVSVFILPACTSMATIQAMDPKEEWEVQGRYNNVAFCFIDKFEAGSSFWTKGVALDFRDRTDRKEATIQGSAKADRNFGIFELKTKQLSDNLTLMELRAVEGDPSTEAAYKVATECSAGSHDAD